MKKTTSKYIAKATAAALASTMAVTGVINVAPISIVAEAASSEAEANISAFIERMYTKAMDRKSDPNGKKYWMDQVLGQTSDAASMARDFLIAAPEMKNRNLNNDEYVEVLYQTFFDRASDKAGKDYWVGELNGGKSRESVVAGFVNSKEFGNICVKYGVSQGYMNEDGTVANPGIGLFVYRLYDTLLGRKPDAQGIMYWVEQIVTGKTTIEEVATTEFILSNEFQKMAASMTDRQYVGVLYATFFNRTPDKAGETYWRIQLASGAEREKVVYGFSDSNEFRKLLTNYGLSTELKNKYTPVAETVTEADLTQTYTSWRTKEQKTYDAKDALLRRTEYSFNDNGTETGYKEYTVVNGKEVLTYERIAEYDSLGRRTRNLYKRYEFTDETQTKTYLYYTYDYTYKDGNYISDVDTYYNVDGKVTSIHCYYPDGTSSSESFGEVDGKWVTTYKSASKNTYDADGHTVKYESESYSTSNQYYDENIGWVYESGPLHLTRKEVTNYTYKDGLKSDSVEVRTQYDKNGKVTSEEEFKITFQYNDDKKLVKESHIGKEHVDREYTYEYDKKGNQTKYSSYYWTTSIWNNDSKNWDYDEKGKFVLSSWSEYTYDDAGNEIGYVSWNGANSAKPYRSSWSESTYQKFQNDYYYKMSQDYYHRVYKGWDSEKQDYIYIDDAYDYGYKYDRDEYGNQTAYYYYTADENYKKTLSYFEKYYWSQIKYPENPKKGDTYVVTYSEQFGADEKLLERRENTYIAYEYEYER